MAETKAYESDSGLLLAVFCIVGGLALANTLASTLGIDLAAELRKLSERNSLNFS